MLKYLALSTMLIAGTVTNANAQEGSFVYRGESEIPNMATLVHNGIVYHVVVGDLLDGYTVVEITEKQITLRVGRHFIEIPRYCYAGRKRCAWYE